MYCVQQQTITCPLNRNKAAGTAISKANIADAKAFYGFIFFFKFEDLFDF